MSVRLVAIDLDGTLLNSEWQLSKTNADALRRTVSCGVIVAFVTGRRYTFARPLFDRFYFPYYTITNAGASTRTPSGDLLFKHPLKSDVTRRLLRYMHPYRPWTFLIFDAPGPHEVLCESPHVTNPHVSRYIGLNEEYLTHVSNLEDAPNDHLLQIALMGHVSDIRQAAAFIESFSERSAFNILRTEYVARDFALLDVIDAGINKGRAVAELANLAGVRREEVMAIGDNHNDLDMLLFAGLPVVMENAPDDLKRYGWPITSSNDANGVAQAIERFVFKNPI